MFALLLTSLISSAYNHWTFYSLALSFTLLSHSREMCLDEGSICSRHASACLINSTCSLISLHIVQLCNTETCFYNYNLLDMIISVNPSAVLPQSAIIQSRLILCCVGILQARASMAGGTSCSDITRRHKGIPYIKYSAGRKKKRGKSSLPKLKGLGLTPRGCASTPLQKASCHISNL